MNARLVGEGRVAIGFGHAVADRRAREGTAACDTPMPNLPIGPAGRAAFALLRIGCLEAGFTLAGAPVPAVAAGPVSRPGERQPRRPAAR